LLEAQVYLELKMSNTDFLGRAIETVKKAIEQDTAGEYEKAYQQYYQACMHRMSITCSPRY